MWLIRNGTCDLWVDSYSQDIWLLVRECRKTTFSLKVPQKFFISKFNLKAIADIVFDLRNEFHVNRLKFGILGTKMFSTSILNYFDTPRTKYRKFWPLIVLISWKIGDYPIFVWGIRKNWSRDDLSTPRFQVLRILLTFSLKSKYYNNNLNYY
jgi:hypothetical protein